jgi:hypothetical protein
LVLCFMSGDVNTAEIFFAEFAEDNANSVCELHSVHDKDTEYDDDDENDDDDRSWVQWLHEMILLA